MEEELVAQTEDTPVTTEAQADPFEGAVDATPEQAAVIADATQEAAPDWNRLLREVPIDVLRTHDRFRGTLGDELNKRFAAMQAQREAEEAARRAAEDQRRRLEAQLNLDDDELGRMRRQEIIEAEQQQRLEQLRRDAELAGAAKVSWAIQQQMLGLLPDDRARQDFLYRIQQPEMVPNPIRDAAELTREVKSYLDQMRDEHEIQKRVEAELAKRDAQARAAERQSRNRPDIGTGTPAGVPNIMDMDPQKFDQFWEEQRRQALAKRTML